MLRHVTYKRNEKDFATKVVEDDITGTVSMYVGDNPVVVAETNPVTGGIELSGTGSVLTPKVSLTSTLLTDCILGQLPDGRFVGFGDTDSSFDTRLFISTAYSGGTITRVNSSRTFAGGDLKDTAGASICGANAGIIGAFFPSNGDILMVARAHSQASQHLFRIKPNANYGVANTVGNDANYSNGRAILDIGSLTQGSGQASCVIGTKANYGRCFCEATIGGAKVYLFAEYNVAAGRVNGSTNDQAIVWQSTDLGATWSKLLVFNTDGSTHQIDHFHGVLQDPYSGWIYFLTGDNGAENAVIAWDGVSAAPAANASLATIKATTGWRVISGGELNRYTDLCFGPTGLYSFPDCDDEAADTTSIAYVGTQMPRTLDYVATIAPVQRTKNLPPIMAARHKSGFAVMTSFMTADASIEDYLHIWIQDDPNGLLPWRLANKIRNYISATAVPWNLFWGTDGALYLCGKYGAGVQFSSVSKSGTTIRFEIKDYASGVAVFDGA